MASDMSVHFTRISLPPNKSQRTRKSIAERIRELGLDLTRKKSHASYENLKYVEIKTEQNRPSVISIMVPNLNLHRIVYYQPVSDEVFFKKKVYKIENFETTSTGPKSFKRISDIEVKSYKPVNKKKFRKKKRQSSVSSKVEKILNRGKKNWTSKDDLSEESIYSEDEMEYQPSKGITDLPKNVLQKLFLCFSQKERCLILAKVCKYWNSILKDPIFWKELKFVGSQTSTTAIIQLLQTYFYIESLWLIAVPNVVNILRELSRCNHDLKQLGIKHCNVEHRDFSRILLHVISCCTNLQVLDLKGMQFNSDRFYLELGRLKNLTSLNFSGNKSLKNQNLITVSINCRALTDLRFVDTVAENSFNSILNDDDLIFIITHLKQNLKSLKIDMQQLGSLSYQAILSCPGLKYLSLENCLLLNGSVFRQFPVLLKLKKLKITRAINLKADDFEAVFSNENMHNIVKLNLNGCWGIGDKGFRAIIYQLQSLESLSLKNCKSLKENDLQLLTNCPKLIYLNVAHTGIDFSKTDTLNKFTTNLKYLVIDNDISIKSLRKLKTALPFLTIFLSYSEFQKAEEIFRD